MHLRQNIVIFFAFPICETRTEHTIFKCIKIDNAITQAHDCGVETRGEEDEQIQGCG